MNKRKIFLIFFVFLLFIGQTVFAVDDLDKCQIGEDKIPCEVRADRKRGSQYGDFYLTALLSRGLEFQEDSIGLELYVDINQKKIRLSDLIDEFKVFETNEDLEVYSSGFKYKLSKDQLRLLNGLDNNAEIILNYMVKITKDAYYYIPKTGKCGVDYSINGGSGSSPIPVNNKDSEIITVVWDDDNDRDGIRTNQEVYYLRLDNANDDENGPLFKVLEIPSRGNNEENQVFGNVPAGWEAYELDGRELENYEKIISKDDFTITYKHIPEKTDFNVNVVWEDENNKYNTRPDDINFTVSPQGMGKDYSVKASNNWSKSFQEYKFDEGEELRYNLKFPDIGKYNKEVKKAGNNYTVTYTIKPIEAEEIKPIATKDLVATKTWVGGKEEDHKEVNLELYRSIKGSDEEEKVSENYEVKEEKGKFTYTWNNMRVTNDDGKEYKYFVKEAEVPENYEVTYHGLDVTNNYKSPTKDITVNVKWVGGDPQDTKIILYRKNTNSDLEEVGVFNSNKDNLSKTFEDMPVTDDKGQDYTYYAYEPEVPEGFTVSYSDDELTVTNTKMPEVKPEPKPEVRPEPKPNPKPDTQVVEKIEEPIFKRHDYTPTYPVVTRVPEEDSLKYIFTIDDYNYEEIRNGVTRYYKMDVAPLIKNERTMLPLRYVGEALDAEVKWNEDTRTATFIKNGRRAEIQIDNDEIVLLNGEIIKMDSKPVNINSRILVPVTNVANVFGLTNGNTEDNIKQDIEWDKDTRTVTIYVR